MVYTLTPNLSPTSFLIKFSLKLEQTYAHVFMYHYKLAIKNISQVEINSIISRCVLVRIYHLRLSSYISIALFIIFFLYVSTNVQEIGNG
jgi:hypothetical protein